MNPGNNAGELSLSTDCKFKLTIRKGHIHENPRGGSVGEFVVQIGEGLGVVQAKALNCVRSLLPEASLISENIYFKKSKGASQSSFEILTTENINKVCMYIFINSVIISHINFSLYLACYLSLESNF